MSEKELLLYDVLSQQHLGHGVRQRLHDRLHDGVRGRLVPAVLMAPATSAAECDGAQPSGGGRGELLPSEFRVKPNPLETLSLTLTLTLT